MMRRPMGMVATPERAFALTVGLRAWMLFLAAAGPSIACDDPHGALPPTDVCATCDASAHAMHGDAALGTRGRSDASARDADSGPWRTPTDAGTAFVLEVDAGAGTQPCEAFAPADRLGAITWRISLPVGANDAAGRLMAGTEVRSLAVFDEKLFAAQGIWMDPDDAATDQPGPQVVVLDRPESNGGAWKVDFELTERIDRPESASHMTHRYTTFSTMRAVRFERDASGVPLDEPVAFLVAGVWDKFAEMNVFVRDVSGDWETTTLEPGATPLSLTGCHHHVRSFLVHRDTKTGADLLFAGTSAQGAGCPTLIYRGAYDRALGRIAWSTKPEAWDNGPDDQDRVTTMAVANGRAYASACGKIFERKDGANPIWSRIYTHPDDYCPAGPGENGFRGATAIPGPDGERLLLAMEGWNAHLGVLSLRPDVAWHNELDTNDHLQAWLGTPIGYSIVAYDGMLRFRLPGCAEVTLMGLEANTPGVSGAWNGWARPAHYFVRYDDASYEDRRVRDRSLATEPPLVAVRTMIASPFPEDRGLVLYAGGFDANHVTADDTGWLYRGTLARAE